MSAVIPLPDCCVAQGCRVAVMDDPREFAVTVIHGERRQDFDLVLADGWTDFRDEVLGWLASCHDSPPNLNE